MKTISNLTGSCCNVESHVTSKGSTDIYTTRARKGFWRRTRKAKSGIYFESSSGGSVFVSEDELWKMVEAHDENLCEPKLVADNKV